MQIISAFTLTSFLYGLNMTLEEGPTLLILSIKENFVAPYHPASAQNQVLLCKMQSPDLVTIVGLCCVLLVSGCRRGDLRKYYPHLSGH